MLDPRLLRADINAVKVALSHRKVALDVDLYSALETQRKALQVKTQELQNERNSRSKAIGQAKAKGEDIQPLLAAVQSLGEQLKEAEQALNEIQEQLNAFFLSFYLCGSYEKKVQRGTRSKIKLQCPELHSFFFIRNRFIRNPGLGSSKF